MSETGTNGYDARRVRSLVETILEEHEAIDSLNQANAERVAVHRGNIGAKYKEAEKAFGINKKALKEHIKTVLEDKKREERRRDLDIDDRSALEMIKDCLSDTPLGQAAERAARAAAGDDDADLRPRHLQEAERQRAEENAERLASGIKPLEEGKKGRGRKGKDAPTTSLEDLETLGSVN